MNSNQKPENTWITDLNHSVDNIKHKEKVNKLFKYILLISGCGILFIMVIILGKSRLQIVNPKINIASIDSNTQLKITELETIVHTPKKKQKKNVNNVVHSQVTKTSKKDNNHLTLNRPNSSLNEKKVITSSHSKKKNGKHITYYDNGNKWVELNFVNGVREGIQYTWHHNGQLKSELHYVNGKKHGLQKWLQKNGKILNEKTYTNGEWHKR